MFHSSGNDALSRTILNNLALPGPLSFTLSGEDLEIVDSYTYLGITFTYSGNLAKSIKDLQTKAMKALFKISSTLKSKDILSAELDLKLFDSMVKPICLYGCQVWWDRMLKYIVS